METATFAGGCFWCMEPPYAKLEGVSNTTPGYMGGHIDNPTYEQVCTGSTGHTEVVQVVFDPQLVSYEKLLKAFWENIDPTQANGQFADQGSQYRPEIFYHNEDQKRSAKLSKQALQSSGRFAEDIIVKITKATTFHPAEEYHHAYYNKNEVHYKMYRKGSGREDFLKKTWG